MHKIMLIIRATAALMVIAMLLGFGFVVFMALFLLAGLTAVGMKLRGFPKDVTTTHEREINPEHAPTTPHSLKPPQHTITIIEGEAEEVQRKP
jgi:type III secretory pathway component EscV